MLWVRCIATISLLGYWSPGCIGYPDVIIILNDGGCSQAFEQRLAAGGPDAVEVFFLLLVIAEKENKAVMDRGGFQC